MKGTGDHCLPTHPPGSTFPGSRGVWPFSVTGVAARWTSPAPAARHARQHAQPRGDMTKVRGGTSPKCCGLGPWAVGLGCGLGLSAWPRVVDVCGPWGTVGAVGRTVDCGPWLWGVGARSLDPSTVPGGGASGLWQSLCCSPASSTSATLPPSPTRQHSAKRSGRTALAPRHACVRPCAHFNVRLL